jgi:hypothetical protein
LWRNMLDCMAALNTVHLTLRSDKMKPSELA